MLGTLIAIGSVIVLSVGFFFAWDWWNKRKFRLEENRANDAFEAEVMAYPPNPNAPPEVNEAFDNLRRAMVDDLRSHEDG